MCCLAACSFSDAKLSISRCFAWTSAFKERSSAPQPYTGFTTSIPMTTRMWSGTSTTAKHNKQVLKMVDAVFSSSVAGQAHAPNPTSAVKDIVEFVSVSVAIHVCDVKQTKASRQAAAGLKNFAWSTGKPMGRPREPRGRRPCGRSRKQRPAQVKKRIKMKAAGIQPGPCTSLPLRKAFVWAPSMATTGIAQEAKKCFQASQPPPR